MISKRLMALMFVLVGFTLLVSSSVLADDGRINRAPYHFGGDTLFCSQEEGCLLLDKNGHELSHWLQDDIATAIATVDQSNVNTKVKGDGKGTYGPMQLWAVSPDAATGNNTLCMIGFDEWGKQNDMCFQVTLDWHYEQAPLPAVSGEVDHSCDQWSIGDFVRLISDHSKQGKITAINYKDNTVTFGNTVTLAAASYTAKCSEVEAGVPI